MFALDLAPQPSVCEYRWKSVVVSSEMEYGDASAATLCFVPSTRTAQTTLHYPDPWLSPLEKLLLIPSHCSLAQLSSPPAGVSV